MRILLTNDDGIFAPGLMALRSLLTEIAEVTVVAPEAEQSCSAHSISLYKPILCHRIERDGRFFGYAIDGTPADCVKIALTELLSEPPDLVVSGINPAHNTGTYVLYSGTVAAAIEGAMGQVPSAAVSIAHFPTAPAQDGPDFARAAEVAVPLLKVIENLPDSRGVAFNINIPADMHDLRGVKFVRQSRLVPTETYVRRTDPRGRTYFWIEGDSERRMTFEPDTDRSALADGWVTVTPLRFDLTDDETMTRLAEVPWTDALK